MRVRLAHALIAFSVAAVGGLSAFSSSSPPTVSEAQFDSVGTLNFPTSGSPEAQAHFLRGVAILHSFGWKQAIAEFKKAQAAQPDFAMAYWGETLCYNHPLQSEQDAKNPRDVLARLGPTPAARLAKAPTAREKGFLQAIEALWGEGDWRARRIAYMDAMAQLHREFPTDDEVTTFYVVALLSGARALDDNSFRYEVRAGALALDVFKRNPTHPGAPHYAIHAFDDPIHAPLALDSARAYASIAPAVAHAVHMPTHIFIQHGMWHEVASQNMRGYQVARDLWQEGDPPGDMAHALDWGQYGFLQQGDYAGARKAVELFDEMATTTKHRRAQSAAALSKARYIIETEEWKVQPVADDASPETLLANGLSAVRTKDLATAEQMAAKLAARAGAGPAPGAGGGAHADHGGAPPPAATGGSEEAKSPRVMHKELVALITLHKGQNEQAITLLQEAVGIEESMRPPNGAADPVKPSHELLGEVLLANGKAAEAAKAFDTCLLRMPNRARSLIGAARAHAAAGNKEKAADRFEALKVMWKGAPFTNPTTEAQ
ncbi:MAG: tetratricopeptide repeat protein [Vicinamibacterales bacterium]